MHQRRTRTTFINPLQLLNIQKMQGENIQIDSSIQPSSGKKTWLVFLIAAVIIIAVIVVSVFFILREPSENPDKPTNTGTSGEGTSTTKIPTEVYLAYKQEFDNSQDFDSYTAVVKKYGTASQVVKIRESESLSSELKENIFSIAKSLAPSYSDLDIDNIQETITGNTATLIINTKDGSLQGTITMIKENNAWKLEEDSWKA